ncbi:Ig-like domain-containing protein [Streptomyces griseoluteus]|uniref:Ig-like domain-containing protein n=1 Tax=Streptomyces griseoluteus TaxID=29306 RepID=UPI003702A57D
MRSIRCRGRLVVAAALAAVLGTASPAAAVASTTTVTATPQSTTEGSPVHLQAVVACSSDPGGGLGVTLFDGSTELTTVPVGADGRADYTTTFSAGAHNITAAYNGNGDCDASHATTTVQVTSAPIPPAPTPSGCLLLCGLFGFATGDINIHNNINT